MGMAGRVWWAGVASVATAAVLVLAATSLTDAASPSAVGAGAGSSPTATSTTGGGSSPGSMPGMSGSNTPGATSAGPSTSATVCPNVQGTTTMSDGMVMAPVPSGAPTAAELNTALTALNATISSAQQASAVLGDSSQQVASTTASLTTQIASVQADQANLEDVNIATATTQLDSETTNYQAALWAASQAIPETLVKFIAP